MINSNDPDLESIEAAISGCLRIIKKPNYWDEYCKRANVEIDRPAAAILLTLSREKLTFQTLVARLGVEAPSISRKVHELEHQGLIKRAETTDKRVHELHLSEQGRAIAKSITDAKQAILSEVLNGWDKSDKKVLGQLLNQLVSDMSLFFENKSKERSLE